MVVFMITWQSSTARRRKVNGVRASVLWLDQQPVDSFNLCCP